MRMMFILDVQCSGVLQLRSVIEYVIKFFNVKLSFLFVSPKHRNTFVGRIKIQATDRTAVIVIGKDGKVRLSITISDTVAVNHFSTDGLDNVETFQFFFCGNYLWFFIFENCR